MSERYKAVEGSESANCCFKATVVDTKIPNPSFRNEPDWVCECFDMESAQKIADALNTAHYNCEEELFRVRQDRDQQYDMKVKAREQRDRVTAELIAVRAECEKLRKDAERYWWLRRGGNDDIGVVRDFNVTDRGSASVAYTYEEVLYGARLDAAIDAAIKEENRDG